eukprot:1556374-Pyramimonas_sp.AAC.1
MRPSTGPNLRTFEGGLPQDAREHATSTRTTRAPSQNRPRSHTSVRQHHVWTPFRLRPSAVRCIVFFV